LSLLWELGIDDSEYGQGLQLVQNDSILGTTVSCMQRFKTVCYSNPVDCLDADNWFHCSCYINNIRNVLIRKRTNEKCKNFCSSKSDFQSFIDINFGSRLKLKISTRLRSIVKCLFFLNPLRAAKQYSTKRGG